MVVTVRSLGLSGLEGYPVFAECFLSGGLPAFDIVGLPDAAVREARERVRAAVKNCGAKFPVSRITVNLAPAGTKKAGTVYDLPILLGILAANGDLPPLPEDAAFLGELSLTGSLRGVTGVLPMALAARAAGIRTLYVPAENAAEATLAQGLTVYGPKDVTELLSHLRGETPLAPAPAWEPEAEDLSALPDFRDVMGQENAKRALEIAAAGRRPQRASHRLSRCGQVHAGPAPALHPAGAHPPGGPGEQRRLVHRRTAGQPPPPPDPPPLPRPAPQLLRLRSRGRRASHAPRGDQPRPQRFPLPG